MLDSRIGFARKSDPENISNKPAKRPPHDYNTKSMRNIIFRTQNEEYDANEERSVKLV